MSEYHQDGIITTIHNLHEVFDLEGYLIEVEMNCEFKKGSDFHNWKWDKQCSSEIFICILLKVKHRITLFLFKKSLAKVLTEKTGLNFSERPDSWYEKIKFAINRYKFYLEVTKKISKKARESLDGIIDNIDLECANELGITIKVTPDVATQAVAELTIGLMFDVLRKISFRDREIRKGNWNKEMGYLFRDKKIGIVGLGRIGKTVANLSIALGAKVTATDINPDINWAKKNKVKIVKFNDIFKESNIISIHISSSPNNLSLIGKKELSQMKKGSYLINLSRGGIVDEEALYFALKNKYIAGAAVDVFDQEPYDGKLTSLDNVVLSSHVGSYAKESRLRMEIESVKNLLGTLNKTD